MKNSEFRIPNSEFLIACVLSSSMSFSEVSGPRYRLLSSALAVFVLAVGCQPAPTGVASLRMAYPHEMVTMDPHAHADIVTRTVLSGVYEGLVHFEPGLPVRAGLADRWTTPEDTVWRMHVREGVRFHDGSLLTPADVIASIERARTSGVAGHQLGNVVGVRELEERVVEITTDVPTPLLLTRLENVAIVPRNFNPAVPVGTGPYMWRVGSIQGPVVLQRWADYWGERPEAEEVSILFPSDIEELAALIHQGRMDVVASVSVSYVRDHEPTEGWRVAAIPGAATTYIGVNRSQPPLDDIRVREAIDLAIDRDALVAEIYPTGMAEVGTSIVSPMVFGFSPEHHLPEIEIERSRELLRQAGVSEGTTLRLDVPDRYGELAESISRILSEVGLEIETVQHSWDTFYRRMGRSENQLFIFSWNFRVADGSPFLDTIVHSRDPIRGLGRFNGASISDPELDRLIEEAAHEPQSEIRLERLQVVLGRVAEEMVYLPLFHPSELTLLRDPFVLESRLVRPQDVRLKR